MVVIKVVGNFEGFEVREILEAVEKIKNIRLFTKTYVKWRSVILDVVEEMDGLNVVISVDGCDVLVVVTRVEGCVVLLVDGPVKNVVM